MADPKTLPDLRAERDVARLDHEDAMGEMKRYDDRDTGERRERDFNRCLDTLDTLLRLHAQVTTLENAEKLAMAVSDDALVGDWLDRLDAGNELSVVQETMRECASFLRATVEGA